MYIRLPVRFVLTFDFNFYRFFGIDFEKYITFKANLFHSIHKPSLCSSPTTNLGPIGSAVLKFIGYKQTKKRQTDKQSIEEHPLNFEFCNQAKNIPVLLPSSQIKILDEMIKRFLSYDRTYK